MEKRSLKSLLKVRNLYQLSTTLGLEPVSIVLDPVTSGPPQTN